ncbi:hypothetical protein SPONN_2418 [uncultured Candidatus Thioglobus sp.]|nr:hypothetical protein SPONN_2418 [uncultured Candidatus Thioglobus sp.]
MFCVLKIKKSLLVKSDNQVSATVEKVKTNGIADVTLDVGNLATAY